MPNRSHFHTRLAEAVAEGTRRPFAVLLIDFDDFRAVNEKLGQMRADGLLAELANAMAAALGETDTIARIGGDEFAILLSGIVCPAEAQAAAVALRLRLARNRAEGAEAAVASFAIGISLFPGDGTRPDQLLEAAELALYRAKAEGRDQTSVFSRALVTAAEERRRLIHEVRIALDERQFEVFYQPIVDLRSGIIRGWEALVRWRHPRRGLLQPGEFLPPLDDTELAVDIDRHVLERGLGQMRLWLDQALPVTCIGVNISARQLRFDGFFEEIVAALHRHDLTPDRLKLEILETAFFGRSVDVVAATIARLSAHGVVCALDDFGTGYASLTHLKQFKVERIKIDRSFIKNILHDAHDRAITRSMVDLGRNLGLRVTAEGVETEEQLRVVRTCGCDCAQGYLFGRPMPAEAVPDMLTSWNAGRGAVLLGIGSANENRDRAKV